jgi:predicted outer membrane repeat protein
VLQVTLSGISVTGGLAQGDGGGILSSENLILNDSAVIDNQATGAGGGIYCVGASLTITGGTVASNRAGTRGGGILAPASVMLTETNISANVSVNSGAGIFMDMGNMSVVRSVIAANVSQSRGGGIATEHNLFGGLVITDSVISGNTGGGIATSYGPVSVTGTTIEGNTTSGNGAGIAFGGSGEVFVSNSTIKNNHAGGNGGGVAMDVLGGSLEICNSTFSENTAGGDGGGVYGNNRTSVRFTNSTASGNSAKRFGGGIVAANEFSPNGAIIRHATIAFNRADSDNDGSGGGGGLFLANSAVVENSIISGNTAAPSSEPDVQSVWGGGTLKYSLIGKDNGTPYASPSYAFTSTASIIGTPEMPANPNLGPLQGNGGSNETHALLSGSIAIDAGDPAAMSGVGNVPRYDGRGTTYDRVANARVDMGAYEFGAVTADFDDDGDADGSDFLTWQRNLGVTAPNGVHENGDADLDGDIDSADLAALTRQFGAPECLDAVFAVSSSHATALALVTKDNQGAADARATALDSVYAAGDFTVLFMPLAEPEFITLRRWRRLR